MTMEQEEPELLGSVLCIYKWEVRVTPEKSSRYGIGTSSPNFRFTSKSSRRMTTCVGVRRNSHTEMHVRPVETGVAGMAPFPSPTRGLFPWRHLDFVALAHTRGFN